MNHWVFVFESQVGSLLHCFFFDIKRFILIWYVSSVNKLFKVIVSSSSYSSVHFQKLLLCVFVSICKCMCMFLWGYLCLFVSICSHLTIKYLIGCIQPYSSKFVAMLAIHCWSKTPSNPHWRHQMMHIVLKQVSKPI